MQGNIGIITIHNSPSYGASLQSFALYHYIVSNGLNCEIIDLHRPYQDDYIPSKQFIPYSNNHISPLTKGKRQIKKLLKLLMFKHKVKSSEMNFFSVGARKKFEAFNSQIKLSRSFYGIDELYASPPLYDVYISGSDQLWNHLQPYCMEPYFLTFVKDINAKKISFATSIGITFLSDNEKANFKKWLEQYDSISVREKQAQQLLQSFVDKPIMQIADPTFLLDSNEWKLLSIEPAQTKPYILLFILHYDLNLVEYGRKLAAESGMILIVLNQIQPTVSNNEYVAVTEAGPREFIGYIGNADMVLTDSFHCTAFSIIMGTKNFYTYIAPSNKKGSRIIDLLSTYGLQNHLLNVSLKESMYELENRIITHSEIEEIMKYERTRSRTFLDNSLNK